MKGFVLLFAALSACARTATPKTVDGEAFGEYHVSVGCEPAELVVDTFESYVRADPREAHQRSIRSIRLDADGTGVIVEATLDGLSAMRIFLGDGCPMPTDSEPIELPKPRVVDARASLSK